MTASQVKAWQDECTRLEQAWRAVPDRTGPEELRAWLAYMRCVCGDGPDPEPDRDIDALAVRLEAAKDDEEQPGFVPLDLPVHMSDHKGWKA